MQNNSENRPECTGSAKRIVKITLLSLLTAIVVAIVSVIVWLGPLAKWCVEKYDMELMGRELEMEELSIKLFSGEVAASNITLYEQDATTHFVHIDNFSLEVVLKSLFNSHIHIASVTLDAPYARVDQDGDFFNFDDMLTFIATQYASEEEPTKESEPWKITVDNIAINNGHFLYYDHEISQRWELTALDVASPSFQLGDYTTHVDASTVINEVGKFAGSVDFNYATYDFAFDGTLADFPIADTYHYITPFLNIGSITGAANANISVKGNIMDIMAMDIHGEASTKELGITSSTGDPVLSANELKVGIEEVNINKGRYILSNLEASGFKSKMELNADGTNNFDPLFYNDPTVVIETTATEQGTEDIYNVKERVTVTTTEDESLLEDMELLIRRVSLRGGSFSYADYTMHRSFEYELNNIFLAGDSVSLMNKNRITIGAQLPKQGSVLMRWDGSLSDFHNQSLMLMLNNVDMVGISPYLEHYTGFPIKDGNLTFRSQNVVSNGSLSGINQFGTYNFKLGKRDKDIDAEIRLPLRLAVYMLTDKDEHIDIDLPVSGNIDSPKFSYGKIIMKAIGGLMLKLIVSPFEFLSGDKQDAFRHINIDILDQGLNSEHYARLDKMAEALKQDSTVQVRLTQRVNHDRAAQRLANLNLKIAYYNNTYGRERGYLDMLAISRINDMKISNGEVMMYADSMLLARGIDPTHMNNQEKAMTLYGDMIDGQMKMLMERRNRIINDYMSFQHKDIPAGSFSIAPVVIEDMKNHLSKDRYTVTLIIDEQEVELPVNEDEESESVEGEDISTLDEADKANNAESNTEGIIVEPEDNLSTANTLESVQTTDTTENEDINN